MLRARFVPVAALGAVVLALTPVLAAAQSPPSTQNQAELKVEAAKGKTVRLTETSGARLSGRLQSITTTAVVLQAEGREVTVPLTNIRKVERVSRAVVKGVVAGAIAGFFYGYLVTEEDSEWGEMGGGAIISGLGAAAGAGIGALIARARRGHNLVYQSASAKKTLTAMPVWSPGRTGFSVALRW